MRNNRSGSDAQTIKTQAALLVESVSLLQQPQIFALLDEDQKKKVLFWSPRVSMLKAQSEWPDNASNLKILADALTQPQAEIDGVVKKFIQARKDSIAKLQDYTQSLRSFLPDNLSAEEQAMWNARISDVSQNFKVFTQQLENVHSMQDFARIHQKILAEREKLSALHADITKIFQPAMQAEKQKLDKQIGEFGQAIQNLSKGPEDPEKKLIAIIQERFEALPEKIHKASDFDQIKLIKNELAELNTLKNEVLALREDRLKKANRYGVMPDMATLQSQSVKKQPEPPRSNVEQIMKEGAYTAVPPPVPKAQQKPVVQPSTPQTKPVNQSAYAQMPSRETAKPVGAQQPKAAPPPVMQQNNPVTRPPQYGPIPNGPIPVTKAEQRVQQPPRQENVSPSRYGVMPDAQKVDANQKPPVMPAPVSQAEMQARNYTSIPTTKAEQKPVQPLQDKTTRSENSAAVYDVMPNMEVPKSEEERTNAPQPPLNTAKRGATPETPYGSLKDLGVDPRVEKQPVVSQPPTPKMETPSPVQQKSFIPSAPPDGQRERANTDKLSKHRFYAPKVANPEADKQAVEAISNMVKLPAEHWKEKRFGFPSTPSVIQQLAKVINNGEGQSPTAMLGKLQDIVKKEKKDSHSKEVTEFCEAIQKGEPNLLKAMDTVASKQQHRKI